MKAYQKKSWICAEFTGFKFKQTLLPPFPPDTYSHEVIWSTLFVDRPCSAQTNTSSLQCMPYT